MAAGDTEFSADERCSTAFDAVMEVAIEECGVDGQLQERLARMTGADPDTDCDAALAAGLDEGTCDDFGDVRQWVGCRALDLIQSEGAGLADAMEDAWDEAKTACANKGHPV